MEYEVKDVKEPETCKNEHINQYVRVDREGRVWQYCFGCDRKLYVR